MKSLSQMCNDMLCEAIRNKDFENAKAIISEYFKKKGIFHFPGLDDIKLDGEECFANFVFSPQTNLCAYLAWKKNGSTDIDSIGFLENAQEMLFNYSRNNVVKFNTKVLVLNHNLIDLNVTQAVKLTADVLSGNVGMSKVAIEDWMKKNNILEESVTESQEINEASALDLKKERDKARRQLRKAELAGDEAEITRLQGEYDRLNKEFAAARAKLGGNSIKENSPVILRPDREVEKLQDEFEERAKPEERFKDMENYINMVLKGLNPSAVICGAPGVGKTYRITQKIKSKGYRMMDNYFIIKGKCTPMSVYQTLFEYSHPGDLIVIDDADDIIKNELSINLLKAACDSADERWVNYGTSKPIPAAPEKAEMNPDLPWEIDDKGRTCYPRNFLFNGSVIIITNMAAGQLDTALRNRSLLCDLSFTTKECLEIIESLMPKLGVGKLSEGSKQEAYQYLCQLNEQGADMEISIRSFNVVANILEASEGDTASAQRMIKEQMKLQFARGGKKY